jgi:hypothetical protein
MVEKRINQKPPVKKTTPSKIEEAAFTKNDFLLALEKAIQPVQKPRPASRKIKTSA